MDWLQRIRQLLTTTQGQVAAVAAVVVVLAAGGGLAVLVGGKHPAGGSAQPNGAYATPSASASAEALASASPGATPSAGATPGTPTRSGGGGGGTPTGSSGGAAPQPTDHPITTSNGFTITPAHLFSGAADTQGITAQQITLCMHAAISLGAAFNEKASDINVYWTALNKSGGLLGRQVNMQIFDDAYTAQGAQQAFSECQGINPFFIMGGIGFDQDPVVRSLAEQNAELYLYTMADDGSQGTGAPKPYKYSFTGAPTIEQAGTWLAQATLHYRNKAPFGAVYVKDPNWIGGYNTYSSYMSSHGAPIASGNTCTMNAGGDVSGFSTCITQLQVNGVKTVYMWMNALAFDSFVSQASQQGFHPSYVTPDGFDLVTGTVGQDIDDASGYPAAIGGWITPAFDPNNHEVPWYGEESKMMAAYATYDSGHQPDDIDWMAWLGFKQMTDAFNLCGNQCTRNDFAGIFDSGWSGQTAPLCSVDFSRNHNFGGQSMNLWYAHRVPYVSVDYPQASQHTVWVQTQTCQNRFN